MDNHIITRWVRRAGMLEGQYAHHTTAGVPPCWQAFGWVYRGLAEYTLTAVFITPQDSLDFPRMKDAKEAARQGLLDSLGAYRRRVAEAEGQGLSA